MSSRSEIVGRQEILGRDEILGNDEILGAFVGRQEILGRDEILGSDEIGLPRHARHAPKYYKNPVQVRDKFGRMRTLYRWKNGKLNAIPELIGRDEILGAFVGRQEILGRDEILGDDESGWGWRSIKRAAKSSVTAPFKAVKYSFTVPYRATKAYVTNTQLDKLSDLTRFSGAFVGDDDRQLAAEGGQCERDALARRTHSGRAACGYNSHWAHIRGEDKKPDADASSRRAAVQLLKTAAGAGSISRTDLKKAIWLHAGKTSTEKERTAVGSKMIAYLNKQKVRLV